MNPSDIEDVLTLSALLRDSQPEAELIAALIEWRNNGRVTVDLAVTNGPATASVRPTGKRGKATESTDSDTFEPTPDPAADEDPGF